VSQSARGKDDVLASILEPSRLDRVDRSLSLDERIAEPRSRVSARLVRANAVRALFILNERKMRLEFLLEIVVDMSPAHDIPQSPER
jgi:hypothetical protein